MARETKFGWITFWTLSVDVAVEPKYMESAHHYVLHLVPASEDLIFISCVMMSIRGICSPALTIGNYS